ncbi:MAG TPA: polyamine aminopropyltransferase [Candidatus Limnocylindria bacterium]|nr:polyamine aminopropyltransferase [Candidatus Limnocylindria bacterium]
MDDLWYSEYHVPTARFSIQVKGQLHRERSDFQHIAVYESEGFGRFLTLDGVMMLTERDEFIYHEMITHPAMAVNPDIRRVLVIGAGDGGVLRELSKYPGIESMDVAEIDPRVVEVCREFLPQTAKGLSDPRVTLHFQDGIKFVRHKRSAYDLIIVDSTDPFGPGEVLFTREFYGNCLTALKEDGILINQNESPFYPEDAVSMQSAHRAIAQIFPESHVYQAHIPTYPSGHWLFGFASRGLHPLRDHKAAAWEALGIKTRYYNPALHGGAFCLPTYVKELLEIGEERSDLPGL